MFIQTFRKKSFFSKSEILKSLFVNMCHRMKGTARFRSVDVQDLHTVIIEDI